MTHSAALSILPWGVNVVCTNLAGWLGDKAINERGLDRTLVRKVMQGIASLGPAACLLALAYDQGAPLPCYSPYREYRPLLFLLFLLLVLCSNLLIMGAKVTAFQRATFPVMSPLGANNHSRPI